MVVEERGVKGIYWTELIQLEDVCHIPGTVHRILSLNKLLEEGMHIYGNNAAISLFTKGNNKPFMQVIPHYPGDVF